MDWGSAVSGFFNFLGSIVGGSLGLKATRETNAANVAMNRETNATNMDIANTTNATNYQIAQENNETQIELADKAYQRSTASNQIAEFIKAGYSSEQAKILASGSQASYTAPTLQQATMIPGAPQQAGHVEAPDYSFMQSAGDSIGQVTGSAINSLTDPTGGALGVMLSKDLQDFIVEHFPNQQWSNAQDMIDFCKQHADPNAAPETDGQASYDVDEEGKSVEVQRSVGWACNQILNIANLKRGYNTVMARNSLNTFLQRCITEDTNLNTMQIAQNNVNKSFNESLIAEYQATRDDIDTIIKQLELDNLVELAKATNRASIARLKADLEQYNLNYKKFSDPQFQADWLAHALSNQRTERLYQEAIELLRNDELELARNNPALRHIVAIADFLTENNFVSASGELLQSISNLIPAAKLPKVFKKKTTSRTLDDGSTETITEVL